MFIHSLIIHLPLGNHIAVIAGKSLIEFHDFPSYKPARWSGWSGTSQPYLREHPSLWVVAVAPGDHTPPQRPVPGAPFAIVLRSHRAYLGFWNKNSKLLYFEWSPPWHFKTASWQHFCLKLLSRDFCPTNYPNHLFHLAGHCTGQTVKQDINMSVDHVK